MKVLMMTHVVVIILRIRLIVRSKMKTLECKKDHWISLMGSNKNIQQLQENFISNSNISSSNNINNKDQENNLE